MNVLVDTSIWSLAYRRPETDLSASQRKLKLELVELIREGRVRVIGAVCQELLSGIRDVKKFAEIRADLRSFDEIVVTMSDYERAAETSNQLRRKGIPGWPTDCLIAAIAVFQGISVFSTDEDFQHFAKYIPLTLHTVR